VGFALDFIWQMRILDILLLFLCLSSVIFYSYGIYAAMSFLRHSYSFDPEFHPAITILKPVCGVDTDTDRNLASFCRQNYPKYQIVFGVRDRRDPVIPIVRKIIRQFPEVDIRLVVSDRLIGANLKVSNLANTLGFAKYEILIVADSDIRVGTDYLRKVVQPLKDPRVGVVTCLYRSLAQGWVTTLEAISAATDFHAGVLVSNQLEGIKFAFGSTIVIRKQALEAIGGFEAIADYLADDFQLGHLTTQAGYKVVLSDYIVEHILGSSSLWDSIKRQIRWSRCIRVSRPWGYAGLIFTYGTLTSLLLLITTGGSPFGWTGLVITWMMRLIMGWIVGVRLLNDTIATKFLLVVPLRDLLNCAIWCYSLVGSKIEWRGQQLRLTKGGKLVAISTDSLNNTLLSRLSSLT
jgi:ceramide glucosyltransferase